MRVTAPWQFDHVTYPRLSLDLRVMPGLMWVGHAGTRELGAELNLDTGKNYPILNLTAARYRLPGSGAMPEVIARQFLLGIIIRLQPNMGPHKTAVEEHGSGYPLREWTT